jgi:hypothetical protein
MKRSETLTLRKMKKGNIYSGRNMKHSEALILRKQKRENSLLET